MNDIIMKYNKSTKTTHVYSDESENASIPSLYIKKSYFHGENIPKSIKITIENND